MQEEFPFIEGFMAAAKRLKKTACMNAKMHIYLY